MPQLNSKYATIQHFCAAQRITLPKNEDWRTTPCRVGEIVGLPGSRGEVVATNGILCYIEREPSGELFLGHLDWFKVERAAKSPSTQADSGKATTNTSNKARSLAMEFIV